MIESRVKVYEAIAEAVAAEGVSAVFGLMGDGNMDFMAALHRRGDVEVYHVRHEGAALAMADGYARATGRVGVCTVTCGPGLTQLGTSMMSASRRGSPIVVMAGDTATAQKTTGALQDMDQEAFVRASSGIAQPLRSAETAAADTRRAFGLALTMRQPVVLNAPIDHQLAEAPASWAYEPVRAQIERAAPINPDPGEVRAAAEMIMGSKRPVVLAGRGAVLAGARGVLGELAERTGAAVATTLPAKGFFDRDPFDIGIAGGFSHALAEERLKEADLLIAFGASLNPFTFREDLLRQARLIAVMTEPSSLAMRDRDPDLTVRGDAAVTATEILECLRAEDHRGIGFRDPARPKPSGDPRLREMVDWQVDLPAGLVDQRQLMLELDELLPRDCQVVTGVGHFFSFPAMFLSGFETRSFHFALEFGAIGQGLATAIGVAVADREKPTVLFEGDASLLMNVQELDTAARSRLPLMIVVMNDEALGAEFHKLRFKGHDPTLAVHSTPDLSAIARGFGIPAETVTDLRELPELVSRWRRAESSPVHLLDVRLSTAVVSRPYRRLYRPVVAGD